MYVLELAGQDDQFAAYEASLVASDVSVVGPGLATARGLTDRFEGLAFTHRASEFVGHGEGSVEGARAVLAATTLDPPTDETVAVRAVDVRGRTGVDTQRAERELGDLLVERGYAVELESPDNELRVMFVEVDGESGSRVYLGWLAAETERGFGERAPTDRPFFQPGSMDPMLARALANLAGARPGATVLDPMCGTGGILIEAGLLGARVVGLDVQTKMVEGTRQNLKYSLEGNWGVGRADAGSLPVADDAVDAVVFDAPYGRQSRIEGRLDELLHDALVEARRVAPRCVVVGDRPWAQTANHTGWQTEAAFERRVHRSLTRYVLVLVRR